MFAINILALAGLAAASVMPGSYQAGPIMRRANDTVVTTTKVVAHYTTYCPEPTIFSLGTKTYTVTEPTTLTITDCPCTIVEPCYTCPAPTATGTEGPTGPPAPPAPTSPPEGENPALPPPEGENPALPPPEGENPALPPPESGAAEGNQLYGVAVLVGAAMVGLLAL
ncbi:Cell wall protein-like protein [Hapsidospora chrysogenum ATCC 11550]|uniref:Cell wall protein-like protein n=1 Tax=Hapsidospora chrysogenum (strain ATCC 11550 / CBS 779.69 / DSM 880 / IAM 14645 / JCM 23072 / IMI 49137) TaxID=857340 RepID=A0A086T2V8_HAPC1|nr:Cell wall protein-like protein [Hapsidospora chrysogenum ATCC 11550]